MYQAKIWPDIVWIESGHCQLDASNTSQCGLNWNATFVQDKSFLQWQNGAHLVFYPTEQISWVGLQA